MAKIPSPCISVCKYRREGHCIACSMTKDQKSLWKGLKKRKQQSAFLNLLVNQQAALGKFTHWMPVYLRKCRKKGVSDPFA